MIIQNDFRKKVYKITFKTWAYVQSAFIGFQKNIKRCVKADIQFDL